jgi:hypothetical protein
MKKASIILSLIAMVYFAGARQTTTVASVKQATPVMKVDSKRSAITAPVSTSAEPAKACCQGKTPAQCSHDSKTCNKDGQAKAACPQKGGSAQTCNHGAVENATEKKTQ